MTADLVEPGQTANSVLSARPNRHKLLERLEQHLIESGDFVGRPGWKRPRRMLRYQDLGLWHAPKASRPRCGAKCRDGHACRAPVVWGMRRCRLHGGLSTGPKTPEGHARIAESNRRRAAARRPATSCPACGDRTFFRVAGAGQAWQCRTCRRHRREQMERAGAILERVTLTG